MTPRIARVLLTLASPGLAALLIYIIYTSLNALIDSFDGDFGMIPGVAGTYLAQAVFVTLLWKRSARWNTFRRIAIFLIPLASFIIAGGVLAVALSLSDDICPGCILFGLPFILQPILYLLLLNNWSRGVASMDSVYHSPEKPKT